MIDVDIRSDFFVVIGGRRRIRHAQHGVCSFAQSLISVGFVSAGWECKNHRRYHGHFESARMKHGGC